MPTASSAVKWDLAPEFEEPEAPEDTAAASQPQRHMSTAKAPLDAGVLPDSVAMDKGLEAVVRRILAEKPPSGGRWTKAAVATALRQQKVHIGDARFAVEVQAG